MIGAVYAKTDREARIMLLEIAKRYLDCNIEMRESHNYHHCMEIKFTNGDAWYAYQYNGSNSCGRRFNVIYIDNQLLEDEKILLKTCATLPPYTEITYFN